MSVASRFHDVEAVRAEYGAGLADRIMAGTMLSDEPADRLLAVLPRGRGPALVDAALRGEAVPGAPAELDAFLAPVWAPPDWIDLDAVRAGAVAWWRAGSFQQLLALTAGSLAYGYGSASLARPLARTGRLERMAARRLAETARWVQLATRPGALDPGPPARAGVRATVRLRLVHALIRRHLLAQPDWDVADWGVPLSVSDTVATGIAGFFVVPTRALEDLGIRYSRRERESILQLWAWVCVLMGAPEEHIPRSYAEAVEWADAATRLDAGGIDESADLLRALLFHGLRWDRALPGPAAVAARHAGAHALAACVRRWLGEERADALEAPDTPLKHLVPVLRPLGRVRDVLHVLPVPDARIVDLELALVAAVMRLAGTPAEHLQPEQVERSATLAA